jgi:hypothetical protein
MAFADLLNLDGKNSGLEEYYYDFSRKDERRGPDYVAYYWVPGVPVWFDYRVLRGFIHASKGKRKPYRVTIPEAVPPAGLQCFSSSLSGGEEFMAKAHSRLDPRGNVPA